jgi:hypothetical protein
MLLVAAGCTTPTKPKESPGAPAPVMDSTPAAPASPAPTASAPTPVAPAPVTPTPVTPAPVAPTPVAPAPVAAAPKSAPALKPAPVAVAKPASIKGSEESSTMFDNFTAYVAAIDGQAVAAGRTGWNVPLSLPAGPRRLKVAFIRGVFTAQADIQFQARPEAAYQLKFATDAQIFGKSSYCEFSIVDAATGEKVLAPTRVPLVKIEAAH